MKEGVDVSDLIEHESQQQQCGRCKQLRDLAEFAPSYRGKTGTWCRSCWSDYREIRRGGPHQPMQCIHCGETFTPKRLDANVKYCSARCRSAVHDLKVKTRRAGIEAPFTACERCGTSRSNDHLRYCLSCIETVRQERLIQNKEHSQPCVRCKVNPRDSSNPSYCTDCHKTINKEYREKRRSKRGPCACCWDAPRMEKSSYCKNCMTVVNREYREKSLGSDKPCARCGVNPRNGSNPSYCVECQQALAKEAQARRGERIPVINCIKCGELRDGRHPSYCKACYRLYNAGRLNTPCARCGKERTDGDGRTNSIYCQICYRDWWLQRQYGITHAQYEDMLAAQNHRCAICEMEANGRPWHVDHNHETGKVRGILCDNCNRALGQLKDNHAVAHRAAEYLKASH